MHPVELRATPSALERPPEPRSRHAEALFEGIDDEVFVHDLDGRILEVNPAACRRLGYTRDELLRMTTRDIDAPEFAAGFTDRLKSQLTQGRLSCEGCHLTKDGRRIPVDINTSFIEYDGRPAVLAVMRDISRRKTAERRLAAQYAVTRTLAEAASLAEASPRILQQLGACLNWELAALWSADSGARALRCTAVWQVPGADAAEWEALTRSQTFVPGVGVPGRAWLAREPVWFTDLDAVGLPRATAAAGMACAFPIVSGGTVLGVIEGYGRQLALPDDDLPAMLAAVGSQLGQFIERRRAEETQQRMQRRLLQSEKLASIGLLSAGVAHEINNPLAYVANNLVVLERDTRGLRELIALFERALPQLEQADPEAARQARALAEEIDLPYIQENLDRVLARTREGVDRMAKIVQGLRGLARTDRPQLEPTSLPDLITSSLEMIRGRIQRRGIRLEQDIADLPPLRCVSTQIGQVLLNLLVNAVQAIEAQPARAEGRIRLTARPTGDELLIEVADNGCGIDAAELPRIFDPFYTSKPVGEGTGLGLSISHGIVTGHGGRIEVESQRGEGSCFRVYLPLEAPRGDA